MLRRCGLAPHAGAGGVLRTASSVTPHFGTMVASSMVLVFLMRIFHTRNNETRNATSSGTIHDLASGISVTCLALAVQDVSIGYKDLARTLSVSIRVVMLVICFFGMLNYFVYNAGMISFLMVQESELPINTLQDILDNPQYQLLVSRGTSDKSYFTSSNYELHKKLLSKINQEGGLISGYDEGEELIKNDSHKVLFVESWFGDVYKSFPCEVVTTGHTFGSVQGTWPFQNQSPYADLFGYHARRMVDLGLTSHMNRKRGDIKCTTKQDETFRPFGYGEVQTLFAISGIGYIMAIIYCIIELGLHYYRQDNENNAALNMDTNDGNEVRMIQMPNERAITI